MLQLRALTEEQSIRTLELILPTTQACRGNHQQLPRIALLNREGGGGDTHKRRERQPGFASMLRKEVDV